MLLSIEINWHVWNCLFVGAIVDSLANEVEELYMASRHRAVTGVLGSHPDSRDVHIINLSITFHGVELLTDTKLELNNGRRYGLIGLNGCGMHIWGFPHCF